MTKDEMKNRINMALKNPILQQGFEIICKENEELKKENTELKKKLKPENCLKLLAKEGYVKFSSVQLDKAKEIITKLVEGIRIISDPKICMSDVDVFVSEAEQFLKEALDNDR